MRFHTALAIIFYSASSCTAAVISHDGLEARQSSMGSGGVVIYTDLKQDNSYDLKAGGQNCSYKYNWLSVTGSTVDLLPFKSRSQATVFGAVQPEGIPLQSNQSSPSNGTQTNAAGLYINLDSSKVQAAPGISAYKVTIGQKATGKNYWYTLPQFNDEIKIQNVKPSWDTWLACDTSVTGTGKLGLYWLGYDGSGVVYIPYPKCIAIRLYAKDEGAKVTPSSKDQQACPSQLA